MTERLSRETIAMLLAWLDHDERPHVPVQREYLRALLEAHEAQRPRPASEAPEGPVLLCYQWLDGSWADGPYVDTSWIGARYHHGIGWFDDRGRSIEGEPVCWLPLPRAPERDDG